MSALLGLVPWWGRVLALAGLAAAIFGYGYAKGYASRDSDADLYQARVEALGEEAAKRAAERKRAQDQTTKELRRAHDTDVGRINAYYAERLWLAESDRDGMPAAAERPREPDGAGREPGPCRADPRFHELERRCALDAARLGRWIEFARKNNFPIGD